MGSIPWRIVYWQGAKVSSYTDGRMGVSSLEGGPPSYTTGNDEAEKLFKTVENSNGDQYKTVNPAAWRIIHVLPRARKLYDNKNLDDHSVAAPEQVEPSGSALGNEVIPHYLLLAPGNMKALEKWVGGQDLVQAFQGGTYTLEEIRRAAKLTDESFATGMPLKPFAKYKPLTNEEFEIAKENPTLPFFSDRPEGPGNPLRSELICDASILRRGQGGVSGFHYAVPYTKELRFPKELTETLLTFAMKFPDDLMTIETLYLAVYAWYDITVAPNRKRETSIPFSKKKVEGWKIPKVSLAECLVYYCHWLRWTEVMGLVEYPHFSRWVHRAVISDRRRTPLVVKETFMDEDRVKALMLQVTSRMPGIEPGMRMSVLPHMLTGTMMPKMINMEPYQTPTPEQLLLTGLPSVLLCGTPHYAFLETPDDVTKLVPLCIPATLANNSLHSTSTPLLNQEWNIKSLRRANQDTPTLICAPRLKAGSVWVWNKAQAAQLYGIPVSETSSSYTEEFVSNNGGPKDNGPKSNDSEDDDFEDDDFKEDVSENDWSEDVDSQASE